MTENERWDRLNRAIDAAGLRIGESGIRGPLSGWEQLLGFTEDEIRHAYLATHKGSKHVEVFIAKLKEIRDGQD